VDEYTRTTSLEVSSQYLCKKSPPTSEDLHRGGQMELWLPMAISSN
jgi:hypothetical protein